MLFLFPVKDGKLSTGRQCNICNHVYLFVCLSVCLSGLIQLIIRKHIKMVSIDGLLALLAAFRKQTCYLARSANLPTGLYILPSVISSFFYSEQSYLSIYWTDFHDRFHQMEGICVNFLDQVHLFQFLKGRCHGNQFCVVSKTQTACDFCNFYTM